MRDWYGQHFLGAELALAAVLTAGFAGWVKWGGEATVNAVLAGNRSALYGTLASIFGALLGFVIAAAAIVLGYSDSDRLAIVRDSPHYDTLWRVFTSSIRWLGFATLAALVALIGDNGAASPKVFLYVCTFGSSVAVARVWRTIWVLENVIRLVTRR